MVRLVEEFLNKYFENDREDAFEKLDKSEPDVTVTAGGAIVTPDDKSLPAAVYTFDQANSHQFADTDQGLRTQAKQAADMDDAAEVEVYGNNLKPLVFNDDPKVDDYVPTSHNSWWDRPEVTAPYDAQKDGAIAQAAVEDYISGLKSGKPSKHIPAAINTVDNKWAKERAAWRKDGIERTDKVNQMKAQQMAGHETNHSRAVAGRW